MPPREAEAASCAEVVVVRIAIARRNRGEGLQSIGRNPLRFAVFAPDLDGITSHEAAKRGVVGFMVIGIILELLTQKLLG